MSDYSNYTAEQETQLVVKILKDSKNLNLRCPSLHCKFVMQNERDVKKHLCAPPPPRRAGAHYRLARGGLAFARNCRCHAAGSELHACTAC